jgi:hypothetical protein
MTRGPLFSINASVRSRACLACVDSGCVADSVAAANTSHETKQTMTTAAITHMHTQHNTRYSHPLECVARSNSPGFPRPGGVTDWSRRGISGSTGRWYPIAVNSELAPR